MNKRKLLMLLGSGRWFFNQTAFTQSLGDEIVANGNMETGDPPGNWNEGANATKSRQSDERTGGSGSYSIKVLESSDGVNSYVVSAPTYATLTGGAFYYLSGWMKNIDANNGLYINWGDSQNNPVPSGGFHSATEWAKYSFIRKLLLDRTSGTIRLYTSNNNGTSGLFDDISFKKITPNTNKVSPSSDMNVDFEYTLPESPHYGESLQLLYRFNNVIESVDSYWYATVYYTTYWRCALLFVSGDTVTSKLNVADIGSTDALRVKVIGNEHRVYTRSTGSWTQRGAAITDATNNTYRGVNVLYSPEVTPLALRGSQPYPF